MDEKTREFLDGVYPYFQILENINTNLLQLINTCTDNQPYQNEELFYQIASDLIRLYPYDQRRKDIKLDCGILLLRKHVPFLKNEYCRMLTNKQCIKALDAIVKVRNKYEHQPHNLRFGFSICGNSSCTMTICYKEKSWTMSTINLTNIVYDLNNIFDKIKELYVKTVLLYGNKYCDHPCYITISKMNFSAHNKVYPRLPWHFIDMEDEINFEL